MHRTPLDRMHASQTAGAQHRIAGRRQMVCMRRARARLIRFDSRAPRARAAGGGRARARRRRCGGGPGRCGARSHGFIAALQQTELDARGHFTAQRNQVGTKR